MKNSVEHVGFNHLTAPDGSPLPLQADGKGPGSMSHEYGLLEKQGVDQGELVKRAKQDAANKVAFESGAFPGKSPVKDPATHG